ncbi:MAG: mercuric transporter MerT family protein [Gammaproteobacteria bacterium]
MASLRKHLWAGAASAVIGSLCCVGPLVLLALGVSGAWIGQLTALEPYRPLLIAVTVIFLALAFRQLYLLPERCEPGETCADPRVRRRQRQLFWAVVVGLAVLIAFPWYAPTFLS